MEKSIEKLIKRLSAVDSMSKSSFISVKGGTSLVDLSEVANYGQCTNSTLDCNKSSNQAGCTNSFRCSDSSNTQGSCSNTNFCRQR